MTYPISIIPYANMEPFRRLGPPRGCELISQTPRQSTIALCEGRILAAPLPVGDLLSVERLVEPLGCYGIAAAGAVRSVLFFSTRPFAEMARPARIHLTEQSSSSVRLLFLLLGREHGFDHLPYLAAKRGAAEGELLIGDDALLRVSREHRRHVTDLAEAWFRGFGLPFVFARWVIHRDAPSDCRSALEEWLELFREREDELVAAAAGPEAKRLGGTPAEMLAYLKQMKRILGPEEIAGQQLFLDELRRHERTPLFEPEPREGDRGSAT